METISLCNTVICSDASPQHLDWTPSTEYWLLIKSQSRALHKICVSFAWDFFMMFINYARLQASGCDFVSGKTLEADWPVHKDTISFCKPKTIVHLVLNMVIQMLLKILLCSFFRASSAKEQLEYLTSDFYLSYHNSKTASDPTQRLLFLELRETYSDRIHSVRDAHSILHRHYAAPFYYEVSKKIKIWLSWAALFLLYTSLHCTMDRWVLEWSKGVKQAWKWL